MQNRPDTKAFGNRGPAGWSESGMSLIWQFHSAVSGVMWPAVSPPGAASVLALQFQFERTQWLPAERLRELQFRQLAVVLRHAYATVPYYHDQWRGVYDPTPELTPARFCTLPLLERRGLQDHFETLKSSDIPAAHGATGEARTSGSTGAPVRVIKTQLSMLFWNAFTLRDHIWHRRNLRGKLAAIRHGVTAGEFAGWGQATNGLVATGPSAVHGIEDDVEAQLSWLQGEQPEYLITHPSMAAELAKSSLAREVHLPRLREVRTFGELLTPEARELCREAWSVPVTDTYSSNEVGYIALQCPQHEHYHVQSEGVLVEILDDAGQACEPGQIGRVVVTTSHNFAMPLVRYELGDYAEVGEPCACGRGLPVLRRIIGRVRNMLVTASGERYWPSFGTRKFIEIAPVLQHQFVQKSFDTIEAKLVTANRLTAEQEEDLRRHILSRLPPGFELKFVYCDGIPRSAGGKYEDFMSEVAASPSS
ncbi:MAG: phenylacetate--CoA ligase family protein [Betaproteobacteria bacterium]|nr:phenylacetate--CoA ligase family protein [Betaproteobacteria bacterium]